MKTYGILGPDGCPDPVRNKATWWRNPSAVLALALAASPASALDPLREVTDYPMALWRQSEGLPQNSVKAILQTRDGYIWLGTKGGLSRFDGAHFERFGESLKESEVWALAEDPDGALWAGMFGGGIARFERGRCTKTYTTADGLASDFVRVLRADGEGRLWVGTDEGLNLVRDGRVTTYASADGLPGTVVGALHAARDGRLWIGTDGGLARLAGGRIESFPEIQFPPRGPNRVTAIVEEPDGAVWVAVFKSGLYHLRHDVVVDHFTARDGLPDDDVNALWLDEHGSLWIGTESGVSRLRQGRFSRYHAGLPVLSANHSFEHVPIHRIRVLHQDREGSLWLGSATNGLAQLKDATFTTYTMRGALPETQLDMVFEDRNGRIWVGSSSGLLRYSDGGFEREARASTTAVGAIAEDARGRLWVAGVGGLDIGLPAGPVPRTECLPKRPSVRFLHSDRKGGMWAGVVDVGLVHYPAGGGCRIFGTDSGLPGTNFRAVAEDAEGALWIALREDGLARFADGRFERFTSADGLAADTVQTVYVDPSGDLWVGTRRGLSRRWRGAWVNYTTAQGLPSSYVYSIIDDGRGFLWFTHGAGVFRVSRSHLDEVAAGRARTVDAQSYGPDDGIRSMLFTVGQQASCRARDGRLWFPANSGVIVVDPGRLRTNRIVPPVHVESVAADGIAYDPSKPVELPAGADSIEIHYAGLSFVTPHRVRFQYQLEGFDRQPVEAGTRRVAYYTNLPGGSYRFHVTAANESGVWNPAGAVLPFTLAPRVYERGWFIALTALSLLGLVWGGVMFRVRGLRSREKQLARRVAERTRALEDEVRAREQAQAALQAEQDLLAARVAERTADLSLANAELARAARLKDEFLANMSHELRTPLNAVLGMAEALQDETYGRVNADQRASLQTIEESGRHLLALINDILDLSKIEAGRLDLEKDPLAVVALCEASLKFVRETAHRKGLAVQLRTDPAAETLHADERRMKQVLVNLLGNAVKFTPAGGTIGLDVSGDAEEGVMRFTVWDTGIGIAPDTLARLFRPFVQADSRLSRAYGGSGLGLALVRRMVELHGGSVAVESALGQGSRFTIALPWAAEPSAGPMGPERSAEMVAPSAAGGDAAVLLVEDNEANIRTIGGYLTARGYHVTVARDGAQALERLKETTPDVVLMDVQMPGMDGLEATRLVRANPAWARLPIIALTSLTMPGDRERCLEAGVNDYMQKPVRLGDLVARIHARLSTARAS